MITVSLHGRSGQGVESAVNILAHSLFVSGLNVQSMFFPAQERRGSYVYGLVKADKNPILSRQIESQDITLIFDTTLDVKEIISNVKERGVAIFNSVERINYSALKKKRIKSYMLDATGISIGLGSKTLPNLPMLGALAKTFNKVSMKTIKSMSETISKDSHALVEEGYKAVKQVK